MLSAFAMTLAVIVVGDALATLLQLPVPGPVIGMMCAASFFVLRGGPDPATARMFDAVIPHAPLLFVAAGAGVIGNLDVIAARFWPIVCVITLGTAVTLVATGLAMQSLLALRDRARRAS